jgi:hypothetical protein
MILKREEIDNNTNSKFKNGEINLFLYRLPTI